MQQHRSIDVGDATLECTLCGLGAPVVLLANAGCSTNYFDPLAHALVTGGLQTISINMRGVGGSCGSLDGATLHDLAGDVAGVIKAIGCGPVHWSDMLSATASPAVWRSISHRWFAA
jgi:pimeloyl-ACP methyl ester carboxylesterase